MKLEYGTVKTYTDRGFGFLNGYIYGEEVFFHISTVAKNRVKNMLDGPINNSNSALSFWYTYDRGSRGLSATRIWTKNIGDIPSEILIATIENVIARLCRMTEITPENSEVLSQIFTDDRIPDSVFNPMFKSPILLSTPEISVKYIRSSQYDRFAGCLNLYDYWDTTEKLSMWVEPVTEMILGKQKLLQLKRKREAKIEEKKVLQEEIRAKKLELKKQKQAELEAKRRLKEAQMEESLQDVIRRGREEKNSSGIRFINSAAQSNFDRIQWKSQLPQVKEIRQPQIHQESCLKHNWRDFEAIVIANRISRLYHFTDRANLDSILRLGGLFSWIDLQTKGIPISKPGGNILSRQLDTRKGLQDYVRLSFNANQPMMRVALEEGRIQTPIILEVDPCVIYWESTKFSHINATDNNAMIGDDLASFRRIRFNMALRGSWTNYAEMKLVQAEVLVKNHIPLEFIKIPNVDIQGKFW